MHLLGTTEWDWNQINQLFMTYGIVPKGEGDAASYIGISLECVHTHWAKLASSTREQVKYARAMPFI